MVKKTEPKSKPKAKAEPVKPKTKAEEPKTEEPMEGMKLPPFGDFLESILAVKGLMPKPKPEEPEPQCNCDDMAEIHIIGSEEMILKLFGKA